MRVTISQSFEVRKFIKVNIPWFKGTDADVQRLYNELRYRRLYDDKLKRTKDIMWEDESFEITYSAKKKLIK